MPTDFMTLTSVRDSLSTAVGRVASGGSQIYERFQKRRDALSILLWAGSQRALNPIDRMMLMETVEKLGGDQDHVIQGLYRDFAKSNKTGRARSGTGSPAIFNLTPNFQTRVREEFDFSHVQHAMRQVSPENFQDQSSRAFQGLMAHYEEMFVMTMFNIMDRHDDQVVAYLLANAWALTGTADAGINYTTVTGDCKVIPAADAPIGSTTTRPVFLNKVHVDAEKNNMTQFGVPFLLASTGLKNHLPEYEIRGENNELNMRQQLSMFQYVFSNKIAENTGIDGANDDTAQFYLTPPDMIEIVPRAAFPYHVNKDGAQSEVVVGNDFYLAPIRIGGQNELFNGFPELVIEVKGKKDTTDTSATYGDPGVIDIVTSMVFTSQIAIAHTPGEDANVTPLVRHRIASV